MEGNTINRAALSVREFSTLFGHHVAWGYRRIYEGRVKVLDDCGSMLIPYSEVQRLLDSAKPYNPEAKDSSNKEPASAR
jgi:hypothetical protein